MIFLLVEKSLTDIARFGEFTDVGRSRELVAFHGQIKTLREQLQGAVD